MSGSGLNRISVTIPGSSSTAQAQRDEAVTKLIAVLGATAQFDLYHYADIASGLGVWGYYAIGYGFSGGTVTIATVTCTGVAHPPSGSNLVAMPDPGLGTVYTWVSIGAPQGIATSGMGGGGSIPQGNNNYYVWNISGNSGAAVADFTAAVTAVNSSVPGTTVRQGFKYVDGVSGAWQVWWICFGAGSAEYAAASATILANNNILYMVTCAGTPNPSTGSSAPAVTLPAFTQTFTTLSAPLSFGPQR